MDKLLLKLAILLEDWVLSIKKRARRRALEKFLSAYDLRDGVFKKKIDRRYNPYEGTNLLLIDELIESGEIAPTDKIMDVGCGAGIFLLYLASKGFKRLCGVEMDTDLYALCQENIAKFRAETSNDCMVHVRKGNAIELPVDDDATCFYMFNPFFDEGTYRAWLAQLESSLNRRQRHVKVILLYPTLASLGAMKACRVLKRKCQIVCRAQVCYVCVRFCIFESVLVR